MSSTSEVGAFLLSRRTALAPEQVGLTRRGHRKVAGLRREEVAALAGVSTDYYTRLEQGRVRTASNSVLESLADALRLDPAERAYLLNLAGPEGLIRSRRAAERQDVSGRLQRMMERFEHQPAFVLGRRQAFVGGNHLAYALLTDFRSVPKEERNLLRWIVLDPAARELYLDWAEIAADVTGVLRAEAARYPDDPTTTRLVGELAMKSEEFRQWWAERSVRDRTAGTKRFLHPVVGRIDIEWAAFSVAESPDQTLFVYTALTNRDADALRMLASWAATTPSEHDDAQPQHERESRGKPASSSD